MMTQIFYRIGKLPRVIIANLKQHICGRVAILKGNVQSLERLKLDPYGLKLLLLHKIIVVV